MPIVRHRVYVPNCGEFEREAHVDDDGQVRFVRYRNVVKPDGPLGQSDAQAFLNSED
jgi:hypothetical protein